VRSGSLPCQAANLVITTFSEAREVIFLRTRNQHKGSFVFSGRINFKLLVSQVTETFLAQLFADFCVRTPQRLEVQGSPQRKSDSEQHLAPSSLPCQ
jgi:hypothetical protein